MAAVPMRDSRLARRGVLIIVGMALFTAFELRPSSATLLDCPGDCNGDRVVTVDEVIGGVEIALGPRSAAPCHAFDLDADGYVTVDEVVRAIDAVLKGCAPRPTRTPTPVIPGGTAFSLVETRDLRGARTVIASPDGRNVYVGSDGGIVAFQRDASTGSVSFLDDVGNATNGLEGVKSLHDLAMAPDGAHLYATSHEAELLVFSRNTDGRLEYLPQAASRATQGSAISAAPDGSIYVASLRYGLAAFGFTTPETVELIQEQEIRFSLGPTDVVVSPCGDSVYVLGRHYLVSPPTTDEISVFHRTSKGAPFERVEMPFVGDPPNVTRPVSGVMSPDGNYLYVVERFADASVAIFERNTGDGRLAFLSDRTWVADLGTPKGMCQTPDGSTIFIFGFGSSNDGRIATLHRDPASGSLQLVDLYRYAETSNRRTPAACTVSADGRNLYVIEGADHMAVFALNSLS